jgi:hypothetical protein
MKKIAFVLFMFVPLLIMAITRTVSLDGTQQYVSIQTAIDASINGDIVEVYPGEYFEHIDTNGRSINIRSRYYLTQSDDTINNTIIHSTPLYSCLKVNTQESVIINGFTLMNNYPVNLGVDLYSSIDYSGGVYVTNNSSIQILNCVITNCIGKGSGGVYFNGINFSMSNTKIYNNYGIDYAGGITVIGEDANSIVFDTSLPNSIYNNTARVAMDLHISQWDNPLNIYLNVFSVNLTQADYFFYNDGGNADITLSILSAYFALINHDLYVSPNGDDTNSGLTPDSPLQTIAYAAKIIESDSVNPKTIYLAAGTYNFSDANQYFPFTLKSHIRLIGHNVDDTVFDNELTKRKYMGITSKDDIVIENISFSPYLSQSGPFGIGDCINVVVRNLNEDIIFENIYVTNADINDENIAFRLYNCNNVYFNGVLINNLLIYGEDANTIGFSIYESDVVIRNSIIANCDGLDVSVLFYQNIEATHANFNLELSNLLIYNNVSTRSLLWSYAPVSLNNSFQRMKINNCTFANNNGDYNRAVLIKGDCDITNSIFYNPLNYRELVFQNVVGTVTYTPSMSYSLLKQPFYANNMSSVTIENVLQNTDPLFIGDYIDSLDIRMPEYYHLSENSPCINTGTADTTGLNLPNMDLAGNHRIWNNRIDMGCYEYGSEPVSNEDHYTPSATDKIAMSIYPNPVYLNGSKSAYSFIEFTLPQKAKEPPLVEIYNIKGQKVKSMRLTESYSSMVRKAGLSKQVKQSGEFYSTVWNGKDDRNKTLGAGTYIVRVIADGNSTVTKKMVLMK